MEEVEATVLSGTRVLLAGVRARLRPPSCGADGREGELALPDGAHLSPGRDYAFEAADGRRGTIAVTRVRGGTAGGTAEFRFTGAFA